MKSTTPRSDIPSLRLISSLLLLGWLFFGAATWSVESREAVGVDLEVERDLLTLALRSYDQLTAQQIQSQRRVEDIEGRIDELIGSTSPSESDLSNLERLSAALALARASTGAFAEQLDFTRQRVIDHQRRILRLERALESLVTAERSDPISGDWLVLVRPSGQEGLFELSLEGTVVSGEYRLDGEFHGSLRGTFVNNRLKLERIDSRHGFDVIYEGLLAPGGQRIDGRWRSTRLEAPGAAGGQWRGTRRDDP